eukprot:717993-Hanusia_phi.AAC.10
MKFTPNNFEICCTGPFPDQRRGDVGATLSAMSVLSTPLPSPSPCQYTDTTDFFVQPSKRTASDEELPLELFSDLDQQCRYLWPNPPEHSSFPAKFSSGMIREDRTKRACLVDSFLGKTLDGAVPVEHCLVDDALMVMNSPLGDLEDPYQEDVGSSSYSLQSSETQCSVAKENIPSSGEPGIKQESCFIKSRLEDCTLLLGRGKTKHLEHLFVEKACERGAVAVLKAIDYQETGSERAGEDRRMVYLCRDEHFQLTGMFIPIDLADPKRVPEIEDIHKTFGRIVRDVKNAVNANGKSKRIHDTSRLDYSNDASNMMQQAGLMSLSMKMKGGRPINDLKGSMVFDESDGKYKVVLVYSEVAVDKYKQAIEKARARSQKRRKLQKDEQESPKDKLIGVKKERPRIRAKAKA